jgi:hypothetical protein
MSSDGRITMRASSGAHNALDNADNATANQLPAVATARTEEA